MKQNEQPERYEPEQEHYALSEDAPLSQEYRQPEEYALLTADGFISVSLEKRNPFLPYQRVLDKAGNTHAIIEYGTHRNCVTQTVIDERRRPHGPCTTWYVENNKIEAEVSYYAEGKRIGVEQWEEENQRAVFDVSRAIVVMKATNEEIRDMQMPPCIKEVFDSAIDTNLQSRRENKERKAALACNYQ